MKFILCDDNPAFMQELLHQIEHYCAVKDWICRHACYPSTSQMLLADLSDADVVFLDVDMPHINGIEAARQLRSLYPRLIIVFVTAYIEYAPEGYCVDAFRYLLKQNLPEMLPLCLDAIWEKLYTSEESLLLPCENRSLPFRLRDILYFEGTSQRHVLVHTLSKTDPLPIRGRLADYEAQLSDKGFLRIQKSFLVNMLHIDQIRNYHASLRSGQSLKVTQQNYAAVKKSYVLWKGRQL